MERLERINQWITLATNVGVLLGLLFLIQEINQNTTAIENEIDTAIFSNAGAGGLVIIENPDIAELLVRSETEAWDSFTPVERQRLGSLWAYALDSAELQYRLRKRGGEALNADNIVFPEAMLNRDSFESFWADVKETGVYPSEFVNFFNAYMADRQR